VLQLLGVCLGGAVGSGARYGVGLWLRPSSAGFSWATLAVNLLGSFLLALLLGFGLSQRESLSPALRLGLTTGLMGGFTTYSTFSVETLAHLQRGAWGMAVLYGVATVVGCLGASGLGFVLGRALAGA